MEPIIADEFFYMEEDSDSDVEIKASEEPHTFNGDPTLYFPVWYSGSYKKFKGFAHVHDIMEIYSRADLEAPRWVHLEFMRGRSRPVESRRGRRSRRRRGKK